ncbi:hypothetical protein niasHT_022671 [Heterodera trifolii]|uniref:Gamma-tubulin complex component n=1 Tax=Heterodera trifolii TaxID=157864 RepID=A0ABD2JRG0_9BILA
MPFCNARFGESNQQYFAQERTDVQTQQIFLAICRSFVSPAVPLTVPLSEDRQGNIYVSLDVLSFDGIRRWGPFAGALAWQKSQFEAVLQTASELRRKLRLIDEFFADPFSYAQGVNSLIDPHSMVTSVCDALSFFAEVKTIAGKMLESEGQFSGMHCFGEFLQTLRKRFSEFPQYLEKFLKSKNDNLTRTEPPIYTFWTDFIQHLDFWPIYESENLMPAWKTTLFEGMVRLLGKYLTLRLKSTRNETANWERLAFLESLWTNDELVLSRLNFVANCGQNIPLEMLEENGQLCPFYETFISHLRKFKEDGRLRFTRCFLLQLVRQSLVRHCVKIDNILLLYLSKYNLLKNQLNFLINVTSLNSFWVRKHSELFDENGPNEKGVNERFSEQFWPLRILLDQRLFHQLFAVCGHLRRVQRTLFKVLAAVPIWQRLAPWAIPFATNCPKGRLCGALGAQLIGQLQQLLHLLFTYFFSLNSFFTRALVENVEKSRNCDENIHFTVLVGMVHEWNNALTKLLSVIEEIFRDPIDELNRINAEFCEFIVSPFVSPSIVDNGPNDQISENNHKENERIGEDGIDDEFRLLDDLSDRLRRVHLYMKHCQLNWTSEIAKTAADEPITYLNFSSQLFIHFPFVSSTADVVGTLIK